MRERANPLFSSLVSISLTHIPPCLTPRAARYYSDNGEDGLDMRKALPRDVHKVPPSLHPPQSRCRCSPPSFRPALYRARRRSRGRICRQKTRSRGAPSSAAEINVDAVCCVRCCSCSHCSCSHCSCRVATGG